MNNIGKNLALWVIIVVLLVALYNIFQGTAPRGPSQPVAYSDFMSEVDRNQVGSVKIKGQSISGAFRDGRPFVTYAPQDPQMVDRLREKNVRIEAGPEQEPTNIFLSSIISWLPFLVVLGLWVFFMRQMQSGGRGAMGFGKSRAKLLTEKVGRVTFDDVAGIDEAKQELVEIVEFLRDPQKFQRLGGKIPKGVLLVGPPGTGKTLLARSIAGEANVPFFTISGSDFVEMFVGVGASRVRDMFEQGKKNAPCIIFIDEIDAVGRHRGAGLGGGNDEREQTLNQLLVEMDGFESNEGVIIIAATNRPDVLDPALLRPGRFDRQVTVPNPDVGGREKILKVHMRKIPLAPDVDAKVIARGTPGFSGADLANLVNEAAILAARRNRRSISTDELQEAIERVIAGPERRSRLITPKEKEIVAYHEAGHAVAMHFLDEHDPVHKITIVPRGMAGGYTMPLPDEETLLRTRNKFRDQLVGLLGGRVAEEIRFKDITTGASNDLERVSGLARAMVTQWGMSEKLGPIRYGEREEMVFLGRQLSEHRNYSDKVAQQIDEEVHGLVEDAHQRCHVILNQNWEKLEVLVKRLLEIETINAPEFEAIMRGETLKESSDKSSETRRPLRGSAHDEPRATGEKRNDGGLDMGGTVPAPA